MFQPTRQASAPRPLRLPQCPNAPGYGELQFISQEALKILGRTIELPFSTIDKKDDFIIAVRLDHEEGDPYWSLSQVIPGGNLTVWQHPTRDLTLICNLVISASGSQTAESSMSRELLMGNRDLATAPDSSIGLSPAAPVRGEAAIVFEPPENGRKATLEGDLKKLQVPNLLQSINLAKMTGRLDVRSKIEGAEVYFESGLPVHCKTNDSIGDIAMVELICWTEGEFRFWPDVRTAARTVNKRLDSVLMEGIALLDQSNYLTKNGLKPESCLIKQYADISENEFRARLANAAPIGIDQQLDFYERIDNRSSLIDLMRKRSLSKSRWVPILFNLVSCGLVQITDQAPVKSRLAGFRALGIDENQVNSVSKGLLRAETQIFSYPALIYFLDQEFLRYEYFNHPLSLIIFSLGQRQSNAENGRVETLQMAAVRRAIERITLVKRHIDLLAHHETFDYALLLPNTDATAAAATANRLADVLRQAPLTSEVDVRNLALAFGVATAPNDCHEADKLLYLARRARDTAKQSGKRVVLAPELAGQFQALA